ncbi:MAG: hypothetical protein KA712_09785 [Myxococcales bacterium]|nr:hypothetical protein [Myxococcales bacterium]
MAYQLPTLPLREPDLGTLRDELQALWRAGRRRPFLVLLCALFGAGVVGLQSARRSPLPVGRVMVRIEEQWSEGSSNRRLSRQELESYVHDVAFSATHLTEMFVERLLDGPPPRDLDPHEVATGIREDLTLEVVHDQILSLFSAKERRRAAFVQVSFRAGSAESALRVTDALADLLVEKAMLAESESSRAHAFAAREASSRAEEELTRARARVTTQLSLIERPSKLAEFVGVALSVERHRAARAKSEEEEAFMRFRAQAEMPLVSLTRGEVRVERPVSRQRTFLTVAGIGFASLLPIAWLLVGAFSSRIEDADDLSRLGLSSLGAIRGAEGPRRRMQ